MNQNDYLRHDATGLADLVRNRDVSTADVTAAAIARAQSVNPKINAVVTTMFDEARETARSGVSGKLAGVPFLIKDLNFVKGVRCSLGSRLWDQFVPDHDAEIVTRYRKAGLVILGKSNTPEVGLAATTESVLLAIWIFTREFDMKHRVDIVTVAVYWYWVTSIWILLYAIIYFVPRLG